MHGGFTYLQQGQAAGKVYGRRHTAYDSRRFLPGRKRDAVMFSGKERRLLSAPYFRLIRRTDNFYEIQSKNTGHFWIIQKNRASRRYPVTIYHKHTRYTPYYHRHGQSYTVLSALQQIESHDIYQMNGKKAVCSGQMQNCL